MTAAFVSHACIGSTPKIVYPNIPSAVRFVLYGSGVSIYKPSENLKDICCDFEEEDYCSEDFYAARSHNLQFLFQSELNNLVRTTNSAELVGSKHNVQNLLAPSVSFLSFRRRQKVFHS